MGPTGMAASPQVWSGPLPGACDVVVVGGGIIGVMTAWHLVARGLRVVVLEKGRIGGEQSSRNWGWVRRQGRDPAELPIMAESMTIWQSLAAELGPGLGLRQTGVMYLARTAAEMAGYEAWLVHARAHGLDTGLLTHEGVASMLGTALHWKGGLYTPSDAHAEPLNAMSVLAAAAAARGVILREGLAVRALDLAAGRVTGVVTEAGRIGCDQVVVAAGAWSRLFLARHGVSIPQLSVRSSVAATAPMPAISPVAATDSRFAFVRRADGSYLLAPGMEQDIFIGPDAMRSFARYLPLLRKEIRTTNFRLSAPRGFPDAWTTPRNWPARWDEDSPSPFEAMRVLDPAANMATVRRFVAEFARSFPGLGPPRVMAAWAGMIDTMPDMLPVVDRATLPGLVIATGMSGHGFGIAPGMGRVVADLVAGAAPGHDLRAFRMSRFSGGAADAPHAPG
jgi:glycine/D-amino acid oxidase-like deaminating enzyme